MTNARPAHTGPRVVLVGPPGSGKSTVARRLAVLLGVAAADLDALIEDQQGRSVPEIFAAEGEPVFRAWESAALEAALVMPGVVLSLGGGTPLAPRNQRLLSHYAEAAGVVVFLDVAADVAAARLGDHHGRPLLAGDTRERFEELMTVRRPAYESVSSLSVDTSDRRPDSVAHLIARHLSRRSQGESTSKAVLTRERREQ